MNEELLEDAKWIIVLFDQANTNGAIESLGHRGKVLKAAIEDLRNTMRANNIDPYVTKNEGCWIEV